MISCRACVSRSRSHRFDGVIQPLAVESSPSRPEIRYPPDAAPNVVVVMLDDVGFGAPGTFGGPVPTPALDRVAGAGLRYNQFHTTALCSPTRAALLTGRNHHSAHMGAIAEIAYGFPGYDGCSRDRSGHVGDHDASARIAQRSATRSARPIRLLSAYCLGPPAPYLARAREQARPRRPHRRRVGTPASVLESAPPRRSDCLRERQALRALDEMTEMDQQQCCCGARRDRCICPAERKTARRRDAPCRSPR